MSRVRSSHTLPEPSLDGGKWSTLWCQCEIADKLVFFQGFGGDSALQKTQILILKIHRTQNFGALKMTKIKPDQSPRKLGNGTLLREGSPHVSKPFPAIRRYDKWTQRTQQQPQKVRFPHHTPYTNIIYTCHTTAHTPRTRLPSLSKRACTSDNYCGDDCRGGHVGGSEGVQYHFRAGACGA